MNVRNTGECKEEPGEKYKNSVAGGLREAESPSELLVVCWQFWVSPDL